MCGSCGLHRPPLAIGFLICFAERAGASSDSTIRCTSVNVSNALCGNGNKEDRIHAIASADIESAKEPNRHITPIIGNGDQLCISSRHIAHDAQITRTFVICGMAAFSSNSLATLILNGVSAKACQRHKLRGLMACACVIRHTYVTAASSGACCASVHIRSDACRYLMAVR